jgi:hypothetical protein
MNWDGIISLLFFSIEAILLVNVLYFSRKNKQLRKGAYLIGLLASYQLMEFVICGLEVKSSFAVYIAFAAISFLPPLGLLFVMEILKKRFIYDRIIFLPAVALLLFYLFTVPEFEVIKCTVLYAVYNYPIGDIYGMFYYLPVMVTIILLFSGLKSEDTLQKKNMKILLTGYIVVSLPVIAAFILHSNGNSYLLNMVESVMCKFALILAVCYAVTILNLSRNDSGERSNS